jgi:hypothetical protein
MYLLLNLSFWCDIILAYFQHLFLKNISNSIVCICIQNINKQYIKESYNKIVNKSWKKGKYLPLEKNAILLYILKLYYNIF